MGETRTKPVSRSLQASARSAQTQEDSENSDPDFVNNAPYEYERKPKRGKKKKGETGSLAKIKQSSQQASSSKHQFSPLNSSSRLKTQNMLTNLFGPMLKGITQQPESEEEEEEEEEEDPEDGEDEYSDEEERAQHKRIFQPQRPSSRLDLKAGRVNSPSVNSGKCASSKPDGSKYLCKRDSDNEESVTEPDTDTEDMFAPLNRSQTNSLPSKKGSQSEATEGSETETDDDFDFDDPFTLNPRPSFPRDISQSLVPFMLDLENDIKIPSPINLFLRGYQREGVQFFYDRYKEGRGGVLGDDMGLGKTIQVISFLAAIMDKYNDRRDLNRRRKHVARLQDDGEWREHRRLPPANSTWPTCLIIAPSTVTHNWEREFQTWGYFEVGMYTGPPEQRRQALKDFKMGRLDVLVTSYDTARGDIELLSDLPWTVIFVDEAHRLKNPVSKLTLSFNRFSCEAHFGLTGTAIQNSYEEMWTLIDWSNRGRIGSLREWRTAVSRPLAVGQSAKATEGERAIAKAVAHILVTKLLPSVFLRRTKDIIRDQLPQKIDEVVFCPLTPRQIKVYKRILAHRELRIKLNGPNPQVNEVACDCGSGLTRGKCCHTMDSAHFFTYLTILLKISNHLALILPSPNDTEEQTKRNREISKIAFEGDGTPKYGPAILLPQFCGKWDVLNLLMKEWQKDRTNKVLIFTKSVKLLDMLDYHLNCNSFSFCRLDGSTKQNERMPLIDTFNHDPDIFVFLISTLAGGTGLNLTSANKVVIFDPNWNPAHDLQAMDRAYRFGQTRDVHVYRLLGAGSIEELIYSRQVYKQQMMKIGYEASHQTRYFDGVQGDTKRKGELFGADNLFKLHEDTLATKMAIERAHLAEFDWALANMEGSKNGKRKSLANGKEALEAEAKSRVTEEGDLRGLATLLLDDDIPAIQKSEAVDEIQQILAAGTIKYTHQNDELLRPSRVEEVSLAESLKKFRKRKAEGDPSRERGHRSQSRRPKIEPVPEWPPRRKHHQPQLTPKSKLRIRQKALVETGLIGHASELPAFAAKFGAMSSEEQAEVIEKLDQHAKKR